MNRSEAIETLRRSEHSLRERGVMHAALFGSRARGDNRPDSDIDFMVESDPDVRVRLCRSQGHIADLFDEPVDVVNRYSLKSYVRPGAPADAVYAFWARSRPLRDILHHIDLASQFVDGYDRISFKTDLRTVYAVPRCLEIISEASRRLPDELKARHPSIPWRQMAAAGNVYRHDYQDVASGIRAGHASTSFTAIATRS